MLTSPFPPSSLPHPHPHPLSLPTADDAASDSGGASCASLRHRASWTGSANRRAHPGARDLATWRNGAKPRGIRCQHLPLRRRPGLASRGLGPVPGGRANFRFEPGGARARCACLVRAAARERAPIGRANQPPRRRDARRARRVRGCVRGHGVRRVSRRCLPAGEREASLCGANHGPWHPHTHSCTCARTHVYALARTHPPHPPLPSSFLLFPPLSLPPTHSLTHTR